MVQEVITLDHPERAKYVALATRRKGRTVKERKPKPADKGNPGPWEFCVMGQPVPKPRMTRADKGLKRPCVQRYFAWCNAIKAIAPADLPLEGCLRVKAYLALPKSFQKGLRAYMSGRPHTLRPDASNLLKGIEDALFPRDEGLYKSELEKLWDDGKGPRVEIFVSR
jgi:Holliday junction resolvase RusA-like endonuclease